MRAQTRLPLHLSVPAALMAALLWPANPLLAQEAFPPAPGGAKPVQVEAGRKDAKAAPGSPQLPLGPRIQPTAPVAEGSQVPSNHPQAVAVINRYLDAIGGLKALEAIKDRTTKFSVIKHAATGETKAIMNLYIKDDYKVREEWDIEGLKIKDKPLSFVQVYNGLEGWVQMFGTVSPLEGKTLTLFVWDKLLDDFFCHWEEDGYNVQYVRTGTVGKEPAEVIETVDFGGANRALYFFSKDSGLLLKREWQEQAQQGMAKKETFYKNYRKIPFSDGSGRNLQFSLLHEIYENADLDTTREFSEVKFNSGLKDDIFDRPEGEEFKGGIGGEPPPSDFTRPEKAEKGKGQPPKAQPAALHPTAAHPPRPPLKSEPRTVPPEGSQAKKK